MKKTAHPEEEEMKMSLGMFPWAWDQRQDSMVRNNSWVPGYLETACWDFAIKAYKGSLGPLLILLRFGQDWKGGSFLYPKPFLSQDTPIKGELSANKERSFPQNPPKNWVSGWTWRKLKH
jgi:hypothetical protein